MRNIKKETEWLKTNYQRIELRYPKNSEQLTKLKQLAGHKTLSQFVKESMDKIIEGDGENGTKTSSECNARN